MPRVVLPICALNWKGPKLLEVFPEDIGIQRTMLLVKTFPNDPIGTKGIPYDGFDVICIYNGGWSITPKGIEVEDVDTDNIGVGIK